MISRYNQSQIKEAGTLGRGRAGFATAIKNGRGAPTEEKILMKCVIWSLMPTKWS